jgi:phenylpropionate dioxygenase-like ring-hydroxylating dioxygenase large terminal subunit
MGALFRQFWLPVLLSGDLPEPDCPPVRLRILSENLVAFRDTAGRVGLLDAYCAHRGASLFWGRNEEHGLRCVYHGWKYDVHGRCVDMPSEPAESNFKDRVLQPAYPTREAGGIVWAYMGPRDHEPEMPGLEWTRVPAGQRYVHKRFQACNYLQNVEGEVDSSHVSFLHRRFDAPLPVAGQQYLSRSKDSSPRFTVTETEYGLLIAARRDWDDESYYWRITQFLMPSYTMIPSEPGAPISFTAAIPADDESMWGFTTTWRPDRSLSDEDVARIESWTGIYAEVEPDSHKTVANRANDYLIDRGRQRTESFTGIRGIREQDMAVQEDQRGPISDRRREHLGTSDVGVIAVRDRLLRAARAVTQGDSPPEVDNSAAYGVRSAALLLNREIPYQQGAKEALLAGH